MPQTSPARRSETSRAYSSEKDNKNTVVAKSATLAAANSIVKKRWKILLAPLALLFVYALARHHVYDEKLYLGGDNLVYYYLAKALASGQGFTDIFSSSNTPHNHFPPGYPFIMSLFMRLGFNSISFYCALNGVIGFIIIVLSYFLTLNITGSKALSFTVGFFLAVSTPFLSYSLTTMSEIPSALFTLVALFVLSRNKLTSPFYRDYHFWILLVCIITGYYVRSSAIVLLPAVLIVYLLRGKWLHALATVSGFVLAIIPWMIRSQQLGGNSYVKQFLMKNPYHASLGPATGQDYLTRIITNAKLYITLELPATIMRDLFPETTIDLATSGYRIAGCGILLLLIYGMFLLIKKQPGLVLYFMGAGAILLIWPSVWTGARFLVPILPFIFFFVLYGSHDLVSKLLHKVRIPWNPLVLCSVAVFFLIPAVKSMGDNVDDPYDQNYQHYFDVAEWANKNLPDTVVIACRKPEIFYYFSGRRSVVYLHDSDSRKLLQHLQEKSVDYVVVEQLGFSSTGKYLVPAIQKNEQQFKILYQTTKPETYLLSFKPE
jgi:hypothetical protein